MTYARILILAPEFDYTLSENAALNATLAEFELPVVIHGTIENDGYGMHVGYCWESQLTPPS